MLRFAVLVHFAVVRFLICGLPVFEKQEGVAFVGASCFWRTSPLWPSICGGKWSFAKLPLPFWQKKSVKISGENHRYGLYSYGLYSHGLCSYGLCSYGLYSYGHGPIALTCSRQQQHLALVALIVGVAFDVAALRLTRVDVAPLRVAGTCAVVPSRSSSSRLNFG